jgi:predicted phage-related endonuclease
LPERYANTYLCQINIYMHLFEEERALILAVQKDSPHALKEFEFVRDDALINAILDKWRFVSQCLDEGWVPTENDDAMHKLPLKG